MKAATKAFIALAALLASVAFILGLASIWTAGQLSSHLGDTAGLLFCTAVVAGFVALACELP